MVNIQRLEEAYDKAWKRWNRAKREYEDAEYLMKKAWQKYREAYIEKSLKNFEKELVKSLLTKKKVKYISRRDFNKAIKEAIKISLNAGIRYKDAFRDEV